MKPVSIRFQCFGPYMAEQYIDFEQLEKSGLFLICGETGAGKTTILDAMCYALYGKSSGGLRGDLSVMRCKLAGKNDETRVEFVLDCGGRRYKFVRSLKYGRKNLNDSHNCMELRDGVYVPIFENPKATNVNEKARQLIGLSYDQFRQVVMLPQGQFEKLLVSDSAEKEKILVSLFHADRWQRIAEELYSRVMAKDSDLRLRRQSVTLKLQGYGCADLGALAEKTEQTRQTLEALKAQIAAGEEELAQWKGRQEAALLENRDFEELRLKQAQLGRLLPLVGRYDSEEKLLDRADRAERIRPQYMAYQEAKQRRLRAEGQLEQAQRQQYQAQTVRRSVCLRQQLHEANQAIQEQNKRNITVLEEGRSLYRSLAEKKTAADRAQWDYRERKAALELCQREFARLDSAWQRALEVQKQAMENYRKAQSIYLQGIGSTLAQRLVEGEPCPVCGSRTHPSPAAPIEGHITDAQLERCNQAMNRANDAVSAAMKARSAGETGYNRALQAMNGSAQNLALAQRDYEDAMTRRIRGIDSLGQLEAELQRLKQQTAEFEREDSQLRGALTDVETRCRVAQAAVDAARQELTAMEAGCAIQTAQWMQALEASGLENESQYAAAAMEPEEKQRRRSALIQFRTDLGNAQKEAAAQQQALEGRTAPDLAGLKRQVQEREWQLSNAGRQAAVLEQQLKTMERDHAQLTQQDADITAQRAVVDGDMEFANRLRGRSGTSMQRYVLGVMLTSITTEANRLLKNVYSGRYQLYRTDEIAGSGRKGGLELEVYDAANAERRSVTTLSGGEKFLVALSLAIGLSTVVQAQSGGIRLEAMFIDEGFGSLDRESVSDALEVLQGIQRSAGVVGIISHVEQLAEVIPTRIEICKAENGSQCRICG